MLAGALALCDAVAIVNHAGWYPDPADAALLRWWDGRVWTDRTAGRAGWYPDPGNAELVRWWDGAVWTEHTNSIRPSVVPKAKPAREPAPTFPARASLWLLAGVIASAVSSEVLGNWSFEHLRGSPTLAFAVFYGLFFAGLLCVCLLISRRFGSGHLSADFGWRAVLGDLWRGGVVVVLVFVASGVAVLPWLNDNDVSRTADQLDRAFGSLPTGAVAVLAVAALAGAPLLEELAFRGVLQRSLTQRFGVRWAILLQAVCFGAFHFTPGLGNFNYAHMATAGAAGVVLGIATARWRRLGPGMVAHMLANSPMVIAVVTSR